MSELERRVDAIMEDVPLDAAFSKWCNAGPCTESMWNAWRERHERRSPSNDRRRGRVLFVDGLEGSQA